jgi:hypothetical protein
VRADRTVAFTGLDGLPLCGDAVAHCDVLHDVLLLQLTRPPHALPRAARVAFRRVNNLVSSLEKKEEKKWSLKLVLDVDTHAMNNTPQIKKKV